MNEAIKLAVLGKVSPGLNWQRQGQTHYHSTRGIVHARFKTRGPFSFNINPASLKADYELWICGNERSYYLLPVAAVREMYEHPDAYPDGRYPEIRVVSVDTGRHRAVFARGGESLDLRQYLHGVLPTAI